MRENPHSSASPRSSFALTGPSRLLDPRTHAVRADIADIRLADRVFAPHYAAPMTRHVVEGTTLRAGRPVDSKAMATLTPGDAFEILEIAGGSAWGVAVSAGLVGYIALSALGLDPA